jgi:protein gp37
MADNTKIEWADATLNYVNGCSVVSPGCTNCYAMKQAHRFPVRQGLSRRSNGGMVWTGEVRAHEPALLQALKWRRGRKIFWNAHGDLFHENVPDEVIDRQFAVMALTPQHTHLLLTKRPERMREYISANRWQAILDEQYEFQASGLCNRQPVGDGWPLPNVWLGTSVEDQVRADERIPSLLATPAAVRFLSCEPLLGPVNLDCPDVDWMQWPEGHGIVGNRLKYDWVIVGGESGPKARPMHPDWVRSLRRQCAAAGVPFFFKQWGEWMPFEIGEDGALNPPMPLTNMTKWRRWTDGVARPAVDGETVASFMKPGTFAAMIGKKAAGNLLDGIVHQAFPGHPEPVEGQHLEFPA